MLLSLSPLGPEFRVNTTTAFDQNGAAVARDSAGNFVVAWSSAESAAVAPEGEPGPMHNVFAQRYNAAGVPQGAEFLVNTTTLDDQAGPAVAMDSNGNFVVVWSSVQDGSGFGIYARRFSAAGAPLSGEVRVNTFTTSSQADASVAMDADGDFVVAWGSYSQELPAVESGVFGQRFNSAGVPQGGEMHINTFTTSSQRNPDVATDAAGNFVVAWESFDEDGSSLGVYGRRFNAAGAPLSGEFQVNVFTTNVQHSPSVASDDAGNFVVAWVSRDQDGSIDGVFARRYNSAGTALSGDVRVNSVTTSVQSGPSVDVDADGDYVVAWHSQGQDGAEYGVYAQQFSAAGVPQGGEIRVNTFTTGSQAGPSAAVDANGNVVVAWSSIPQDGSGSGIYAQRFASSPAPAVVTSDFLFATAPQRLVFQFNQNVGSSLGLNDIVVQQLPTGPTINPNAVSYNATTNTATFTFNAPLPDGRYRARLIASGIIGPGGTLPADHTFDFFFLRGDANHDGRVNLNDFNILAANFGQSPRDFTQADFDYSGNVNLNDFNILASRFGVVIAPTGLPMAMPQTRGLIERLNDVLS